MNMKLLVIFLILIANFTLYSCETKTMDKDMAEQLVIDFLSQKDNPYKLRVIPSDTKEYDTHFKVKALPEKQIETGDIKYGIPGLGLFVVDKQTNKVTNEGSRPSK
jgi:hypothetical protein